jgi:hypothetical protein
LICHFAW